MSQAITHNSFEWHMTRAHSRNLTVSIIMCCRRRLYLLKLLHKLQKTLRRIIFQEELLHIQQVYVCMCVCVSWTLSSEQRFMAWGWVGRKKQKFSPMTTRKTFLTSHQVCWWKWQRRENYRQALVQAIKRGCERIPLMLMSKEQIKFVLLIFHLDGA